MLGPVAVARAPAALAQSPERLSEATPTGPAIRAGIVTTAAGPVVIRLIVVVA
jgi:hypothetical protein